MQQEINFTPIARRNDPQTSQIAAERTNKGKRKCEETGHKARVWGCV